MIKGPTTRDEFMALPIGGGFGRDADGRPVRHATAAFCADEDVILWLCAKDGEIWKLGRYVDGRWFRERYP
jgi:hypothetical protein